MHTQVMLFFDAFNYTWLIGLVFFAIHLFVLGYLIFKSGYMPKFLGILLIIAAIGYLIDSLANFLLSNYSDYKNLFMLIVIVPGIIGELSLTFWLLFKGVKLPESIKSK
jgi:ABC-type multidrug transport system permease subunit